MRLINAGRAVHPMHLHDFCFKVDSRGAERGRHRFLSTSSGSPGGPDEGAHTSRSSSNSVRGAGAPLFHRWMAPPQQAQRRTRGRRRLLDSRRRPSTVPELRSLAIPKLARFPREFDEGGGLKNRHMRERKSWISQVLISRTLSVCGEVAEWPKAAVC